MASYLPLLSRMGGGDGGGGVAASGKLENSGSSSRPLAAHSTVLIFLVDTKVRNRTRDYLPSCLPACLQACLSTGSHIFIVVSIFYFDANNAFMQEVPVQGE